MHYSHRDNSKWGNRGSNTKRLLNTENKTHDYFIYAFIYVSTEKYGNTKCEITIPVKSRIKPENPSEEPLPEPNIFHETVEAVNAAADRAKMAEQNAKASATEAGKYATSASESAEQAKQVATKNGFCKLEIDESGHLKLHRTDNIVDSLDFSLTEKGRLEVMIS